jgi:transketolase
MINREQKLNPKLFDTTYEKELVRKGFGEGLVEAGEKDSRVVALCADVTESVYMHLFREKFSNRFVEIGIGEQNMASVASGMAAMGKVPFIGSYGVFSPGRNWEQIRTTICYNDVNVKIIGSHTGLSVGTDGGSHQALEDIALMRSLPNTIVISPCDIHEAHKAVIASLSIPHPVYIRLTREKMPVITTSETPFEIGKSQVLFDPIVGKPDVAIIATGTMVYPALLAARELEKNHVAVRVVNLATIKPLDEKMVLQTAREVGAIVTVEEHQLAGGMGSAVAEFLSGVCPTPIEFVAVRNAFGESGTAAELWEKHGLTPEGIIEAVKKVVLRKR